MYNSRRSVGAYAFQGGLAFVVVLLPTVMLCEYGAMIGDSFAGEHVMKSLTYWTWIVTVSFPVLPYVFTVIGVGLGRVGMITGGIVLYAIAFAWQIWVIVFAVLLFADCEGEIHCADNLSYVGIITGPYGGPSTRFLFMFVSFIIMAISEIIAIGIIFSARHVLLIIRNTQVRYYATGRRLGTNRNDQRMSRVRANDYREYASDRSRIRKSTEDVDTNGDDYDDDVNQEHVGSTMDVDEMLKEVSKQKF